MRLCGRIYRDELGWWELVEDGVMATSTLRVLPLAPMEAIALALARNELAAAARFHACGPEHMAKIGRLWSRQKSRELMERLHSRPMARLEAAS